MARTTDSDCPFCALDGDGQHEPGCMWTGTLEEGGNAWRAHTAFESLDRFYDADESDDPMAMEEHVTDALADLRHLCRRLDLNWERCLRLAGDHFKAEVCNEESTTQDA